MCTVSWSARTGGYDLFFNRDELTTRAPEIAPSVARREGVAYLAPHDGDQGGTWLLTNHHGLTVCVLNDYGATWRPTSAEPRFSRGHVVSACAALGNSAHAAGVVAQLPLARTPAFHLVVLAPDEAACVLHWNGAELSRARPPLNLPTRTSSSFATAEVIATRTKKFGAFVPLPDRPEIPELAAYHRQHDPGRGSHSVLMRRTDAATRSITHVAVRERTVAMNYEALHWAPHGPVTLPPVSLTLPRSERGP